MTTVAPEQSMAALARDVSLLASVLGGVLREQGGDELFEAVDELRRTARMMRLDPASDARAELERRVEELPLPLALAVVRGVTIYFHLVNMAEENHRLRRLVERQKAAYPAPRPESIGMALQALRDAEVPADEVRELLSRLSIRPVLTSHPTEARRMTLLHHLHRINQLVEVVTDQNVAPESHDRALERLRAEVTNLWQTNELRLQPQTVADEVRHALFYFDQSIFAVTARLYRDLSTALDRTYPSLSTTPFLFLTFGSWVGGDRSGNPRVTPQVIGQTLRMHRALALSKYMESVQHLLGLITPSTVLVQASPALLASLERDVQAFGAVGRGIRAAWSDELYRQKLDFILRRLQNTYARNGAHWTGEALEATGRPGPGYKSAQELLADLDVITESLRAHGGARIAADALQDLIWQVRVFGFHLARLDIRHDRDRQLEALDEIFRLRGVCPSFSQLPEERKIKLLEGAVQAGAVREMIEVSHVFPALSERAQEMIEVFRLVAEMQKELGREAVDTFIVSRTRDASDMLAVLYFASLVGLFSTRKETSHLRVVPLFETEQDLARAPDVMRQLYANSLYRQQLERWGDEQEIMLDYSDRDKEAGYVTSQWSLYRAQQELMAAGREAGIRVTYFHGRGGAIARGGGPLNRAILGQPAGTVDARIKITEQGEVLFARYANPRIAHRHLEQVISAVIRVSAPALWPVAPQTDRWEALAARLSDHAFETYRALFSDEPAFRDFFEAGTPLRSILRILSTVRPSLQPAAPVTLETLGAIPWVFAWAQSRFGIPGWYGLGSALSQLVDDGEIDEMRRMYAQWPFFHWLIDAAQLALGQVELEVARAYSSLVPNREVRERYCDLLASEFHRAVDGVNRVVGQQQLLDSWPVLQRSIELRNPYIAPMSYIQIRAIRELRQEPEGAQAELLRSIVDRSVTGVAAGLQATG